MKLPLATIAPCFILLSCTSGKQEGAKTDSLNATAKVTYIGPIDLAKLTLKEKNAPGMLDAQNVKAEPVADSEQTLLGYEVFKSSSPKLLVYAGVDLSGGNGAKKNHVLLHYNEQTKALVFFEVKLYTQAQADALLLQLQKIGKPQFEKLGLGKGEVEVGLNGNAVEKGKEEKQTYRVWENKNNKLTYFFGELGTGKDFEAELTVLDRSTSAAKDWIALGSLDWYKNN